MVTDWNSWSSVVEQDTPAGHSWSAPYSWVSWIRSAVHSSLVSSALQLGQQCTPAVHLGEGEVVQVWGGRLVAGVQVQPPTLGVHSHHRVQCHSSLLESRACL